jgi:leader peptidase (prepilin peptidase) / N-methyltransferase
VPVLRRRGGAGGAGCGAVDAGAVWVVRWVRGPVRSGTLGEWCPSCGASAGLAVPGAALSTPARCGSCGGCAGPVPFGVKVALAAAVLLGVSTVPSALVPAYARGPSSAVPLVFVDVAVHRLPDRLTYPPALGVFVLLFAGGGPWLRGVVAGVGVGLLLAVSPLQLGRRGFGLADAKLALSCAALLDGVGWRAVVLGLVVAFFASGLLSLTLLATTCVRWSTRLPVRPVPGARGRNSACPGPLIMGSWHRATIHRPTTP